MNCARKPSVLRTCRILRNLSFDRPEAEPPNDHTAIRTTRLRHQLKQLYVWAQGANEHISTILIEVEDDSDRTGIVAGAVFAFSFSLDDVAVSLFLVDPGSMTLPVALVSMMRANFDLTIAAASVLLMGFTLASIFVRDRVVGLDTVVGQGIYRA